MASERVATHATPGYGGKTLDFTVPAPASANSRAQRSTARTSARLPIGDGVPASYAFMARPIKSGIAVRPIRRSRKAETAISLAAFRTIGRPAWPANARNARSRQGNLPVSGAEKSSLPARARSRGGNGALQRAGYENAY